MLDLAKTAPQEAVTDEVSLLLAIKVGLAIEEFKGPLMYQYPGVSRALQGKKRP